MSPEFDDVLVVEALMYFYFAAELFLGPLLGEGALLNDLDGLDLFCFLGDEFIAARKSSLAQEITLNIAFNIIFLEISVLDEEQILMG